MPTAIDELTAEKLIKRGYCCGCCCTNCPYYPRHKTGSTVLDKKFKEKT